MKPYPGRDPSIWKRIRFHNPLPFILDVMRLLVIGFTTNAHVFLLQGTVAMVLLLVLAVALTYFLVT